MLAVQFQRFSHPKRVVKITAAQPFHACPDNFTMTEYKPGEFYEVPAHIAEGMVARQVAVPLGSDPATVAQIPLSQAAGQPGEPGVQEPQKPPPVPRDPSQEPAKPQHEPSKPEDEEPEDDDDDENGEAAKKAKGRRSK